MGGRSSGGTCRNICGADCGTRESGEATVLAGKRRGEQLAVLVLSYQRRDAALVCRRVTARPARAHRQLPVQPRAHRAVSLGSRHRGHPPQNDYHLVGDPHVRGARAPGEGVRLPGVRPLRGRRDGRPDHAVRTRCVPRKPGVRSRRIAQRRATRGARGDGRDRCHGVHQPGHAADPLRHGRLGGLGVGSVPLRPRIPDRGQHRGPAG